MKNPLDEKFIFSYGFTTVRNDEKCLFSLFLSGESIENISNGKYWLVLKIGHFRENLNSHINSSFPWRLNFWGGRMKIRSRKWDSL